MKIDALVFDAYGTLFDVHSITAQCEKYWPGRGGDLSQIWRNKQLEYSWLRSLMGRYESFESLTRDALLFAVEYLDLSTDAEQVANLMKAYGQLAPYPEVSSVLKNFTKCKKAILSNGNDSMLETVVSNSGLEQEFAAILSVDRLRLFKPSPQVYQLAVDALRVPKERVGFISSNCWDACGAQHFGFKSFWINRGNAPLDRLGIRPEHILANLRALPALIKSSPI